MKMSEQWAYVIQDKMQIMYSGSESVTPSYFIGGVWPGEDRFRHWKEGAELVCKLIKSGIMYVEGIDSSVEDPSWYYSNLRNNDPFEPDQVGLWMIRHIGLTKKGRDMVERHNVHLSEKDFDDAFIEEIERVFEEAGV